MSKRDALTLVEPGERLPLVIGASTLFYRRLSLGALAAIERGQTVLVPGQGDGPPRALIPPAALEAAICAHVLVGWENVLDPRVDGPAPFGPGAYSRLPAGARRLLLRRSRRLSPAYNEREE